MLKAGTIHNIIIQEQPTFTSHVGPAHLDLQVHAAGLNFRDVLNILGLDPTGALRPVGLECAGIVNAVGDAVAYLQRSQRVFGMALGCISSRARTDSRVQARMPSNLDFEEASALPILWCTASLATFQSKILRKGIGSIIHAATGGVGLLTLQLAQLVQADDWVSAGRPAKHAHLCAAGLQSRVSSRSAEGFLWGLTCLGKASRIHAVFTALSGEFIVSSLATMSEAGAYLEIGKNRIWSALRFAASSGQAQVRFELVAVDYKPPGWIQDELVRGQWLLLNSCVRPIPLVTFAFARPDVLLALAALRRGDNIGRCAHTFGFL